MIKRGSIDDQKRLNTGSTEYQCKKNRGSIEDHRSISDEQYRSRPAVRSVAMQQDRVSKHGGRGATELQTVLLIQTVSCRRMDQDQDQDLNHDQGQAAPRAHAAR